MSRRRLGALLLALGCLPWPQRLLAEQTPAPLFVDRGSASGVSFVHRHFGAGEKLMPENMGPGAVLFDADGDGLLDLYLPQGAPMRAPAGPEAANAFYRNLGGWRFEDATERSGLGHRGVGMGAAFGDIDADGDLDLFVSNFGPDVLFENLGNGSFEDITAAAGIESELWSTSAGFFDADGDGDLDLYVTRYVDFSLTNHKWCGNAQRKLRAYCHPDVYEAVPDLLYLGDGKGRFSLAGEGSGIRPTPEGKGLGVTFADLDGDGHQDIFVANDSTMNLLYLGRGDGRFAEGALLAGVGFNATGKAEAGMGVVAGDLDGDGLPDLFLTHLDQETNTLYRNLGHGLFEDRTRAAGLASPSLPWVGFGNVLLDHDLDGDLDVFVTNGHIIDNIALFDSSRSHRQPSQLFENLGDGQFREISAALGLAAPLVGRGAAAGDLDRDGDLDLVITQNDGPALLLENRAANAGRGLGVRLRGRRSNPQGFGAVLTLAQGKQRQVRLMHSASGYLSQGPPEAHFALLDSKASATLDVRWPSGITQRIEAPAATPLLELDEPKPEPEPASESSVQ